MVIANLAERSRWARLVNLAVATGTVLVIGFSGLYQALLALLAPRGDGASPLPPAVLVVAALVAGSLLLEPVRARLARVLPLDPASPVTMLALAGVVLLVGLQAEYQLGHDALAAVSRSPRLQPLDVVLQEVPLLVLAVFGVGLFTRRPAGAVLARLGVVRPKPWQVLAALAVAGIFVAASQGAQYLQWLLDPALADRLDRATTHYYANITGVTGILAIALAPGLAEEAFFRGALQPRLGIVVAALAFTAVHTQYALTVDTALVFALGSCLGLVRRHLNTTASMTAHASYNVVAAVGIPFFLLPWAIAIEVLLAIGAVGLWWYSRPPQAMAGTP